MAEHFLREKYDTRAVFICPLCSQELIPYMLEHSKGLLDHMKRVNSNGLNRTTGPSCRKYFYFFHHCLPVNHLISISIDLGWQTRQLTLIPNTVKHFWNLYCCHIDYASCHSTFKTIVHQSSRGKCSSYQKEMKKKLKLAQLKDSVFHDTSLFIDISHRYFK